MLLKRQGESDACYTTWLGSVPKGIAQALISRILSSRIVGYLEGLPKHKSDAANAHETNTFLRAHPS